MSNLNKMAVCQKPVGAADKCLFHAFVPSFLIESVANKYLLLYFLDALMQIYYP